MTFLFAYLASSSQPSGWPLDLIYVTEKAFVTVAIACVVLALILRRSDSLLMRGVVAVVGGISAGFGLIMPFELAPFFFDVHGEIMMASIALILVYPIAAVLFVFLFWKLMDVTRTTRPDRAVPPSLP